MEDFSDGRFEEIREGSEAAKALCELVLQPMANRIEQGDFVRSSTASVALRQKMRYLDGSTIVVSFHASKNDWESDKGCWSANYQLKVEYWRQRNPAEYWPEQPKLPELISEVEDDGDQALELFEYMQSDDYKYDIDEDDDDEIEPEHVREIRQFTIDDTNYLPRKTVQYNYFDTEGTLIDIESVDTTIGDFVMFDVDEDSDSDLQLQNNSLSGSYTPEDVEVIHAICAFDFPNIVTYLSRNGCPISTETLGP